MKECREKILKYIKNELPQEEAIEVERLIERKPECRETYERELKLEKLLFELADTIPVPDFEIKVKRRTFWRFVPAVAALAFIAAIVFKLSIPATATGGQFKLVTPVNQMVLSSESPEIVVTVPEKAEKVSFLLDGELLSGEVKKYDGVYVVKPEYLDEGYHEFKAVLKQGDGFKSITKTFYVVNEK